MIGGWLPEHDSGIVIGRYVVAKELDVGNCTSRDRTVLAKT